MLTEERERVETSLENPAYDSNAVDATDSGGGEGNEALLTSTSVVLDLFPERPVLYNPISSGDRYEDINSTAAALIKIYAPIAVRKATIKETLESFKTVLGLPPDSRISNCFRVLRQNIDSSTQLELMCADQEPLKIKINELAGVSTPPEMKKAVGLLNAVLNYCQKYNGEKELKTADIQYRLDDLHLMPLSKDGQQLYAMLNEIPTYLEEFSADITTLYQLIYDSRDLLRP